MAAGSWIWFNAGKQGVLNGTVDLDSDNFAIRILNGYTPALTHGNMATAGIATAPATNGGQPSQDFSLSATGMSLVATGNNFRWDSAATGSWTAAGGALDGSHAILYHATDDLPMCYTDLATGATGVSTTSGNDLTISFPTSGITLINGATS